MAVLTAQMTWNRFSPSVCFLFCTQHETWVSLCGPKSVTCLMFWRRQVACHLLTSLLCDWCYNSELRSSDLTSPYWSLSHHFGSSFLSIPPHMAIVVFNNEDNIPQSYYYKFVCWLPVHKTWKNKSYMLLNPCALPCIQCTAFGARYRSHFKYNWEQPQRKTTS